MSASFRPPGGVSGCSSNPRQSRSMSYSVCSLTRLLVSATKQKGQTKSDQRVTVMGMGRIYCRWRHGARVGVVGV
jgi:hypothetical protein